MAKRAIIIVLDSAGVGYLPDAALFGDEGADTFGHIIERRGLSVPNMEKLGLYSIAGTSFRKKTAGEISGAFGKCAEMSMAKDTTSGHWEMAGYIRPKPFRTFPQGFTQEIISEFERESGHGVLGNCVASGTEIIRRLGDEHVRTGKLIVYTSADSVFQIAAHEEAVPLEELYSICEKARAMLSGDWAVGRVIARPFAGAGGDYKRTERRRDYAVAPEENTILDEISAAGRSVRAVGKIEDIFCGRGITYSAHTTNNRDGIEETLRLVREGGDGLLFTNLVDFDMLYGHRNDVEGYGAALEYFDRRLPEILDVLKPEDMLIISADHGCDPAFPGTDHTREYIPLLVFGQGVKAGTDLGVRASFADIAASVIDYLGLKKWPAGKSFIPEIV
ncbi:MAG: phosphopentomutase [Oscillospiraceae bacterium]|jgi:phosphopentomutase|nr:phosphopentomutase [Oscillospiraceae bacterium]